MGFISDVGDALSKAAQDVSDTTTLGPMGPIYRQKLNDARNELNGLITEYGQLDTLVKQYEDPVNNVGKYTSSLLHQSSDYIHGVAVNYDAIIADETYNNPNIQMLADSNVIQPIINLPIPGTMGGIPSALIPGVEVTEMVVGLVNLIGDSLTLPLQLAKAEQGIQEAHGYISQEQRVLADLRQTGAYLIQIDNILMSIFQKTCVVEMPRFSAGDPNQLADAAGQLPQVIAKVTDLKGNAFRTMRFIQNVITAKEIQEFNDVQRTFIVDNLMQDRQIAKAFDAPNSLRSFVDQFLDGTLLQGGILTLPPIPDEIRPYLNEQPSDKQAFSDPQSSEFDPPASSLDDFPG